MARPLEESKVDRPVALLPELALPVAGGRHPVGRPQRRPQQRDRHAAHEEGHKEQGATLEVHPGQNEGRRQWASFFLLPLFHARSKH